MKSHVILKDATAVISRVKPQPIIPKNTIRTEIEMSEERCRFIFFGENQCISPLPTKLPYRIGQKVAVKEAYLIEDVGLGEVVVYKSDVPDTYPTGSDKWLSPVTMPIRYVRKWAVVESVECVRVQGLTEEQYKATGAKQMHIDDLGCTWKTYKRGFESAFIAKYGQTAWEQNEYIFITCFKIEG